LRRIAFDHLVKDHKLINLAEASNASDWRMNKAKKRRE
jgi:hypothetical protein